jgi:hypothetical protein
MRKKKEQIIVATIEVTQPSQKPQKISSYRCYIYGLNGHKMTYYPKFIEMPIANVNVVKVIEEQVFKDIKPRKAKSTTNWEKEN